MKNYMGHFGEAISPDSLLAKINEIEVMIAENNVEINGLQSNVDNILKNIKSNESILAEITPMINRVNVIRDFAQRRLNWQASLPRLSYTGGMNVSVSSRRRREEWIKNNPLPPLP